MPFSSYLDISVILGFNTTRHFPVVCVVVTDPGTRPEPDLPRYLSKYCPCKSPQGSRRGPPLYLQVTKITHSQVRLSWTIKEEVIQTLKLENDMSDQRIWFCLRIVIACFSSLYGLYLIRRPDNHTLGVRILALTYTRVYVVTAIVPMFCLLTGQGLTDTAWWSFALVAVALHQFFRSLILQGRRNISQLEALKYDTRGA
ncbi:hypothetical protein BC827DRAFT_1101 [Russula dissimulans]|nr:hypothetical protein BC827DRAFT_1101 [Russula dissimulans]